MANGARSAKREKLANGLAADRRLTIRAGDQVCVNRPTNPDYHGRIGTAGRAWNGRDAETGCAIGPVRSVTIPGLHRGDPCWLPVECLIRLRR